MTYQSVTPEIEPVLLPWLREVAKGIAVMDTEVLPQLDVTGGLHVIEVNNGLGGHSGAGAYIAWTTDPKVAELLAAGLWALLEKHS